MEQRLDAYLLLGCNGSISNDNFVYCHGCENPIIDLSELSSEKYLSVLEFFDNACDLFSAPMNDHNKCINTLSLLYKQYGAYNKLTLNNIQEFIKMHKKCSIWLVLILKEDFENG